MKKRIVLISMIIIAAVLLTTLIFWRYDPQNDNDLELESLEVDTSSDKKVTLKIMLPGLIKPSFWWEKVLDEFENKTYKQLDISIEAKTEDGMYGFIKKIDQGESFDMALLVEDDYYGDYFGNFLKKNILADITALFPRYAPNFYASLSAEEVEGVAVEGKIYGVPAKFPSSKRVCALIRDDLLIKYGRTEIKDMDDLEAFFQFIKAEEKEIVPVYIGSKMIDLFALMHDYVILDREAGIVYRWDDPALKLMPWEQTPEFLSFCERLDSWVQKGYLEKEVNFISPYLVVVSRGKYACLIESFGLIDKYNSDLSHIGVTDWRLTEHVLYPEKISQMDNPSKACVVFKEGSENIEKSLMFLEWLHSSQDNYDLFMYGIKGKTYTLYGEQYSLMGYPMPGYRFIDWPGRGAFRNEKFERSSTTSPPEYSRLYREKLFSISRYPPHLGFFINRMEIGETEYSSLVALNQYNLQQLIQSGKFSGDAISEYIDLRRTREIDRLVDEVQRRLDEWMSRRNGG